MTAAELYSARPRVAPLLERVTFKTSRLAEFCGRRELVAQIGHAIEDWPLVIAKELTDNSTDVAEEGGVAPEIEIVVDTDTGEISVADNGPGLAAEIIPDIIDYTYRVSSREAYVSPIRGAQGNALKTVIAMAFALDGTVGTTTIESRGMRHVITFRVDQLRQEPAIAYQASPLPSCKTGTRVTVWWPHSASSILAAAEERFLQIADDFGWLNPHLRIRVEWNGTERVNREPSNLAWEKWRACDPISAHWYDHARLQRYLAAHARRDEERGASRPLRRFVSELRGFTGSVKQKRVLDETGLTRSSLSSLFGPRGEPRGDRIEALLEALKRHSKPVKPKDLGLIGKDHLNACFKAVGVEVETFKYHKALGETEGLPWIVETAFGWCPKLNSRRIIVGVNWSVGLGNPFRSFSRYGGDGLESLLAEQRAGRNEPIIFVLHYVCPRVAYTDRGKSAIALPGSRQ